MDTPELIWYALVDSAISLAKNQTLPELLQTILEDTRRALPAQAASLALFDELTGTLEFKYSSNIFQQSLAGMKINHQQEPVASVLRLGEGYLIRASEPEAALLQNIYRFSDISIRWYACVPICWQDHTFGIMEALNAESEAGDSQTLTLLSGFASLLAVTLQLAQLAQQEHMAQQQYQDMFESDIDAILITNMVGEINKTNHQAELLIEADKESLQQLKICDLCLNDHEFLGDDYTALELNKTISFESVLTTQKKRIRSIQAFARMIFIKSIPHIQWTLRDISESKKTEALRNDLIAMIYHDLRSPLANIVSSLDVLATLLPLEDDKALKSLLNIAIRSAERIQRLTNSLLDMRKFEDGQAVTNPKMISPIILGKEAIDSVQTVADTKNQKINLDVPTTIPNVWADGDMIRRVLINLLENAIKYTPQYSDITIGAIPINNMVEMYVQDNGPGIPPAEQERIFEKFTRLQEESARGFGLGLAYCRLAVQANGGTIWVESNTPTGACFKLTLPMVNPSASVEI